MKFRLLKVFACIFAVAPLLANFSWAEGPGEMRHESISVPAPFAMPAIAVPVFPQRTFAVTNFGAVEG